ncbi:MAG: hypothetical protein DMF62_05970 [Acidobacteria bacterium]|nr:MAG: hypothetical protein DMF62_05970 [Acidobacteriota bacterium]
MLVGRPRSWIEQNEIGIHSGLINPRSLSPSPAAAIAAIFRTASSIPEPIFPRTNFARTLVKMFLPSWMPAADTAVTRDHHPRASVKRLYIVFVH